MTVVALILEYGLRYGPAAIVAVRKILAQREPSEADWNELTAILAKSGESYFTPKVPNA